MSRARNVIVATGVALVCGLCGPAGAVGAGPVHVGRAFTVRAEAYPMESAPGSQDTQISARQAATKAIASNPPVAAFARAAAADNGLAEAYLGQQGPTADADTATRGDDDDVTKDDGGTHLEVHVNPAPRATSRAAGNTTGGSGTVASLSTADGSAPRLAATAEAAFHDLSIGPFLIGSGRFEGSADTTGVPGGAHAKGFIEMSDASYDGIPIVIGADGVRADDSRIPDPALRQATATIQQAFSPGGFVDIRVVQPKTEVAADGSLARVFGGGVHLYFTNNNPAERYFVSYTLLGGVAETSLGGMLAQPTPDRLPDASPVVPSAPTGSDHPDRAAPAAPPAAEGPAVTAPPRPPALRTLAGFQRVVLQRQWRGWVLALILVAMAWAIAGALRLRVLAPIKQRLDLLADDLADRYLRG